MDMILTIFQLTLCVLLSISHCSVQYAQQLHFIESAILAHLMRKGHALDSAKFLGAVLVFLSHQSVHGGVSFACLLSMELLKQKASLAAN